MDIPRCPRNQKQPCPDSDDPRGKATRQPPARRSIMMLAATAAASAGVHHTKNKEDHHLTDAAAAAMEAEAYAMPPGCSGIGKQFAAGRRHLSAATEVAHLPRRKLEYAGRQYNHTDRRRNGACQYRMQHFCHGQCDARREKQPFKYGPHQKCLCQQIAVSQPAEVWLFRPQPAGNAKALAPAVSSRFTIITTHMPMNDAAAPGQVCPGISIQVIDIVQPPGMSMPPIADMDEPHTTVSAALAANTSAETP